jgi:hypothetical protein
VPQEPRNIQTSMKMTEPPTVHRLMKCSDIDDLAILVHISYQNPWANLFELAGVMWENSPTAVACKGSQDYSELKVLPYNLVKAKMRRLLKRGLVDGCACGCRGDFTLTEKGKQYIGEESVTEKL